MNLNIFRNRTPYLGKIIFKFERYPYYTGGSILNKVHIDLGFTKFVSRLKPYKGLDGWAVNTDRVDVINSYTGGIIGTHTFEGGTLNNSFLSKTGAYIGDLRKGWWYFKNAMTVCEEYPRGVAEVWNTAPKKETLQHGKFGLKGYYGYSHRGGSLFTIGDRLFDPDYQPKEEDYEEWQWSGWVEEFDSKLDKADEFDRKWMEEDGIGCVIPFKMRGPKVIENWEEALQAAINMSKYLS
jgi:hypothetical protein